MKTDFSVTLFVADGVALPANGCEIAIKNALQAVLPAGVEIDVVFPWGSPLCSECIDAGRAAGSESGSLPAPKSASWWLTPMFSFSSWGPLHIVLGLVSSALQVLGLWKLFNLLTT